MKKATLLLDEKWLEFLQKVTEDIHEGEVCQWLSLEEVGE